MASLKRNTFLDDGESDDDAQSQVSDSYERGRSDLADRATKRRRVQTEDDDLSASEDEGVPLTTQSPTDDDEDVQDEDEVGEEHEEVVPSMPSSKKPTPRSVARAEKAARKSGVVYISRIPPFMKPHTLKHFLAPHAPKGLGRVFLTPEDHDTYVSRKKSGGNKKKSFTDGWVEFVSKTEARAAAETLNGNIIGGKKRGYYHDDIWNMKYLSAFKWSHLTEQINAENAERDARMHEEIRKTRQENKIFAQDFERGKMLASMQERRKNKGDAEGQDDLTEQPTRKYRQAKSRHASDRAAAVENASVQRTLSMIF